MARKKLSRKRYSHNIIYKYIKKKKTKHFFDVNNLKRLIFNKINYTIYYVSVNVMEFRHSIKWLVNLQNYEHF